MGNILIPQPYEIDKVTIKVLNPMTGYEFYSTQLDSVAIYKQNARYNIYTFAQKLLMKWYKSNIYKNYKLLILIH